MSLPEVMRDSYIGSIGSSSFIPQNPRSAFEVQTSDPKDGEGPKSPTAKTNNMWFNQTDEDKMINLTCSDHEATVTNINKTEEYNSGYAGLSILPWEEFAFNPRVLNELFFQERTHSITYDPEEVNVFFHGKNVMPPTVGDISENGKSWNVVVDTVNDLRKIRQWLTEKCSVFGITLVYKEKRFGKKKRAPCLVLMDPSKGAIGDKIYTTITRAMESLNRQRRFCVEINLNKCVERWCRRVLLTECQVVGAKLVITNGEEYSNLNGAEDIVCCFLCLPLWLLQAGVYKLHRTVVYDDFFLNFDADDLFLHGTFQDASCQRQQIFHSTEPGTVFRTRSAAQTNLSTLKELGSFKFVAVKKYKKKDNESNSDDEAIDRVKEHSTTTFNELMKERRNKVIKKEKKINKKAAKSTYPKIVEEQETVPKCDEGTTLNLSGPNNHKLEATACIVSATNNAYELSDEEDTVKSPRIPEVSSVYFDKAISDSEFTDETDEAESMRIFSPKMRNQTSMSLNNALFDSEDFDNDMSAVKPFKTSDVDDVITDDEDSDESSKENDTNTKHSVKDDLIEEMHKIEQTLPAIHNDSQFTSKDLASIATQEKSKKELSAKKKKRKNKKKPTVRKVLKDLMKTTEMTDDVVATNDIRFQQAMDNLKKFDPKQEQSKCPLTDMQSDTEKSNKIVDGVAIESCKKQNKNDSNDQSKNVIETVPDKSVNDITHESDACEVEHFTADDSSTDGDEVEMIYQSHTARESDSGKTSNRDTKTCVPTTIISRPKDDDESDTVQELKPVKEKQKLAPLNSNRNSKFNPEQLFRTSAYSHVVTATLPAKSDSQEVSIEDADSSDEDIENLFVSPKVQKAPANVHVPPIKLSFETGPVKTSKRGTKQYNSNRKYLGGSVPAPKKKNQRT